MTSTQRKLLRATRVLLGLLAAPLLPAAATGLALIVLALGSRPLDLMAFMIGVGIMRDAIQVGAPAAVIFGVPAYLLLRRWLITRWRAAAFGAGIAFLSPIVRLPSEFLSGSLGTVSPAAVLWLGVFALPVGLAGGLVFWWIAGLGPARPPETNP